MAWELVGQGGIIELKDLSIYENYIAEGQRAKVEIDLRYDVPSDVIAQLDKLLKDRGIPEVEVEGSKLVKITWRKGFPWLAIIAAIVLGLIVLAVLIVSWRILREIVEVVPAPIIAAGSIAIIALIAVGIILLIRRR